MSSTPRAERNFLKSCRERKGRDRWISKRTPGRSSRISTKSPNEVAIFASGGFGEYKIAENIEKGAEIDAFGVGTKMGVAADAPYTDMAYKLVTYDGRPVLKLSTGKRTLVDEKQVMRVTEGDTLIQDIIALRNEQKGGEPLLKPVMKSGTRQRAPETLSVIRDRFSEEFEALDDRHKSMDNPELLPVRLSPGLQGLQEQIVQKVREKELGES
jgi:nicotinate phosphoribosyltransferase